MNFLQKLRNFVVFPSHSRTMGIVVMLIMVSAISLTVAVSQQQQTLKQRASSATTYAIYLDWSNVSSNLPSFNNGGPYAIHARAASSDYSQEISANDTKYKLVVPKDDIYEVSVCPKDVAFTNFSQGDCYNLNFETPKAETSYTDAPSDIPPCGSGLSCTDNSQQVASCSQDNKNKCLDFSRSRFKDAENVITKDGSIGNIVCCEAKKYQKKNGICTLEQFGEYETLASCNSSSAALAPVAEANTCASQGGICKFSPDTCSSSETSVGSIDCPSEIATCCKPNAVTTCASGEPLDDNIECTTDTNSNGVCTHTARTGAPCTDKNTFKLGVCTSAGTCNANPPADGIVSTNPVTVVETSKTTCEQASSSCAEKCINDSAASGNVSTYTFCIGSCTKIFNDCQAASTIVLQPACNSGKECAEVCNAPADTCSTNNGTKTCTFTTLAAGGSCTPVAIPASSSDTCTVNKCVSPNKCSTSGKCEVVEDKTVTLKITLNTQNIQATPADLSVELALYESTAVAAAIPETLKTPQAFTKTANISDRQYFASTTISVSKLKPGSKYLIFAKSGNMVTRLSFTFSGQTEITAGPVTLVLGDLDNNYKVNFFDYENVFKACYVGKALLSACGSSNFNKDNVVNIADFLTLMQSWSITNQEELKL